MATYTIDQLQKMGAKPIIPSASAGAKKSYTTAELQKIGAKPVTTSNSPETTPVETPAPSKGLLSTLGDIGGSVVNGINEVGKATGLTSLAALPVQLLAKGLNQPDPFAKGIGTDTGPIKAAPVTTYEGKTGGQFATEEAGNALQAASLLFPYGKVAGAAEKVLPAFLGKAAPRLAQIGSGLAGGYGVDVASNLQSDSPNPLKPGLATVLGGALPAVPAVINGVSKIAGETLGRSTGTGFGVIKEAFNAAEAGGEQAKNFTDALRGNTSPEQIVDEAKNSLSQIVSSRSRGYQDLLKTIKGSSQKLDVSPVKTELDNQLEKFQIKPGPKGVLNFNDSTIADRAEQSKVQSIYNDVQRWASGKGDNSPLGIDTLKRRIGGYFSPNSDVRALVTGVKNSAKKVLSDTPGYTPAMKAYAEASDTIEDIQKGLSLGDKASVDTSFRKLTSVLRTNNEFRKQLVDDLDKASGGFLSSKVAGQQLSEGAPRGLARIVDPAIGGAVALTQGISIPLLIGAALTSPRLVGELVNALGISKGVFNQLLDRLGSNAGALTQTAAKTSAALAQQPQPLQQSQDATPHN